MLYQETLSCNDTDTLTTMLQRAVAQITPDQRIVVENEKVNHS